MALVMTRLACGGVSSEMIVRRSRTALHLVALRTKDGVASLSDLVRSSLRLRPDRIPVGEVRGSEALELLKAWGTGHPGGIGTIHAGTALGALRLEQLSWGWPDIRIRRGHWKSGKGVVVETEAQVIRRIFQEYVDGRTPREIAHDLNNERIPPPRGTMRLDIA